ncbi:NAD(P)-binding protein [Penicillium nucicola]|uniref:NAD(P)-binding protein n=1 Tax=Penicillium nucicola TaxID=1850975 RepID=UPI0025456746|nr:NAD(P)-binding protein [Penicillium nucicola]KAJ5766033.1 NAD(P)-binding protein [Penicillium nucicola]
MSTQCQTVAVFGANGQIGRQLLRAMNKSKEGQLKVLAFVSPTSDFQVSDFDEASIIEKRVDLKNITSDHLAKILASHDVNIVVSTLGNEVISKQGVIQDAAAIAGVRRFFPSEFGMHQIPWFENKGGYLHPIWDGKMRCFENATKHPAIQNGQMTYTVIGCGELYDLQEEQILCPWFERDESIKQNGAWGIQKQKWTTPVAQMWPSTSWHASTIPRNLRTGFWDFEVITFPFKKSPSFCGIIQESRLEST